MRFHLTWDFSQARNAHTAALKAAENHTGEMEDAEYKALSAAEYEALDTLMHCDAVTPTEISAKLAIYANRDMAHWKDGDDYLAKLQRDLKHMQGHPVSPGMRASWAAWRKHDAEYTLAASRSDAEADAMTAERDALYFEIARMACTTPGDFILKQYIRLLTSLGGQDARPLQEEGTANPWDIDVGDGEHDARFERADTLGAYDDLDNCDTGMNLLAYGLPDFDAEAWMEAADRVGLPVHLVEQSDNTSGLVIGMLDRRAIMVGEDHHLLPLPPRLKRERDRLRRLIAFDALRYEMVADEIEREWPQLILRQPVTAEA